MEDKPVIKFLRLNPEKDGDIPLPKYMTPGSAGMDLCGAIEEELTLSPGEIQLVPTGFAMAMPLGYEAQIRPRSGLAVKHGITIVNAPGTIDSDYRGEVKIALINLGKSPFTLKRGERVAQMIVNRVCQAAPVLAESLDETARNSGGFGHTGL